MRFGLRTLVLITAIVAFCLAVGGHWYQAFNSRSSAIERLATRVDGTSFIVKEVRGSPRFTFDLGGSSFSKEVGRDLALVKDFERISLWRSSVADEDLACLLPMKAIRYLDLGRTKISSQGTSYLAKLNSLKHLDISNTLVDSTGIKNLSQLHDLEYLCLDGTSVDDSAIDYLSRLQKLKKLEVSGTSMTSQGAQRIANKLPRCRVYCYEGTTHFFYQADTQTLILGE